MTDFSSHFDVAVIGAGMAGLTCAHQLKQAGQRVVVLEKSRGVGGRMATRRLNGTFADHGACYLTPKGDRFQNLIHQLLAAGILSVWTDLVYELGADGKLILPPPENRYPRYVAPDGMTAIAKFLATDLDIRLQQRVQTLELLADRHWQLTAEVMSDTGNHPSAKLSAEAVVVTIPAPQAAMLLQSLPQTVLPPAILESVEAVKFAPCLSTIAGYPSGHNQDWLAQYPDLKALTFSQHPAIAWLGLDSSKRLHSTQPVFVIQSTATFAENYLEAIDLKTAGYQLLQQAAEQLLVPWLANPDWLQVHRWRYAFAQQPLPDNYLAAPTPLPLLFAGDWCGGMKVESAFLSGLAAAAQLNLKQN
jgi:renalase